MQNVKTGLYGILIFGENLVAQRLKYMVGGKEIFKTYFKQKLSMTSFSHYPQHIEVSQRQPHNVIK